MIGLTNSTEKSYKGYPVVTTANQITKWNIQAMLGTVTPTITLPVIDSTCSNEIRIIFKAATANATFISPSSSIYIQTDDTTSTSGSIAFTNLSVGTTYECSFVVLDSTHIGLIMCEWSLA